MKGADRESWGLTRPAIGIALAGPSGPEQWQRQLAIAERADALGMHSLWLPEMHFAPGGTSAPLVALGAFAARTRALRMATTSVLLPIADAPSMAAAVAELDRLCEGRLILGLGRGFRAPLFEAFGIPVAEKRDRFDRVLAEMMRLWSSGGLYAPHRKPHPLLAVAAFGPKGLLQAARHGLPYLASPMEPLALLEENYQRHAENLGAGADAGDVPIPIMRTVYVAADDAESRRVCDALRREQRPPKGRVPRSIARAADADLSERVVVGTRSQVEDGLALHRERLGADLVVARIQVPGASPGEMHASLERLAGEVAPSFARL